MYKFYLIRHGNMPHIAGDPSLSKMGIQQSQLTAIYFKHENITAIYCSPSKRTYETAQIIAKESNIEKIKIDNKLKERFNWGDISSQSFEEFIEEWRKTTIDRNYQPPTGNSSREAGNRLQDFINMMPTNNQTNKTLLLITHGGVIVDLLRNLFSDDYLRSFSPDFLNKGIKECSITQLIINNSSYTLKEFDSVTHLPERLQSKSDGW